MIDKFRNQTNETIWDFLREIGNNKEVFSSYFHEVIYDEAFHFFFYATSNEIVLVCLDIVENGRVEKADKSVKWAEPCLGIFTKVLPDGNVSKSYKDLRLSPAMILYSNAWEMRRYFSDSGLFNELPTIHLMLLTNTHIVNYPEVLTDWQQDQWKPNEFGFSALHDLQGLSREIIFDCLLNGDSFIPINNDLSIDGSEYWLKWEEFLDKGTKTKHL